jgi:hypothetical protein
MGYIVDVYKGISSPVLQREVGKFRSHEDAAAFCGREGIPLEVDLADRGPEVIWAQLREVPD